MNQKQSTTIKITPDKLRQSHYGDNFNQDWTLKDHVNEEEDHVNEEANQWRGDIFRSFYINGQKLTSSNPGDAIKEMQKKLGVSDQAMNEFKAGYRQYMGSFGVEPVYRIKFANQSGDPEGIMIEGSQDPKMHLYVTQDKKIGVRPEVNLKRIYTPESKVPEYKEGFRLQCSVVTDFKPDATGRYQYTSTQITGEDRERMASLTKRSARFDALEKFYEEPKTAYYICVKTKGVGIYDKNANQVLVSEQSYASREEALKAATENYNPLLMAGSKGAESVYIVEAAEDFKSPGEVSKFERLLDSTSFNHGKADENQWPISVKGCQRIQNDWKSDANPNGNLNPVKAEQIQSNPFYKKQLLNHARSEVNKMITELKNDSFLKFIDDVTGDNLTQQKITALRKLESKLADEYNKKPDAPEKAVSEIFKEWESEQQAKMPTQNADQKSPDAEGSAIAKPTVIDRHRAFSIFSETTATRESIDALKKDVQYQEEHTFSAPASLKR